MASVFTPPDGPIPSSPGGGSSSVKRKLPHFLQNFFPASYSILHFGQIAMFVSWNSPSLSHYIGLFGFEESVVVEEGGDGGRDEDGEVVSAWDVAVLLIHASVPSSSRARSHPFFSSRIASRVPFFT